MYERLVRWLHGIYGWIINNYTPFQQHFSHITETKFALGAEPSNIQHLTLAVWVFSPKLKGPSTKLGVTDD